MLDLVKSLSAEFKKAQSKPGWELLSQTDEVARKALGILNSDDIELNAKAKSEVKKLTAVLTKRKFMSPITSHLKAYPLAKGSMSLKVRRAIAKNVNSDVVLRVTVGDKATTGYIMMTTFMSPTAYFKIGYCLCDEDFEMVCQEPGYSVEVNSLSDVTAKQVASLLENLRA